MWLEVLVRHDGWKRYRERERRGNEEENINDKADI